MNFKTTALLLIVLIVVLGLSWHWGVFSLAPIKPEVQPAPTVEASKIFLIAPKLKDVAKIRLELTGKGQLVFEKKGETWRITEPISVAALGWELTDLVSAFETARKIESFVPGRGQYDKLTLKDTGLDVPAYKITFEEKGHTVAYLVGKNVVASENTYVKTPDGQDVIIVDQNLRAKVKKNLNDYRDKQLWDLKRDKITEMDFVSRDGKVFKVVKGGDEKWVLASPLHAPADGGIVNTAITTVGSLRAEDFADDNPKTLMTYGLDKPAWKITVVETEKVEPTTRPSTQSAKAPPTIKRTEHVILFGNAAGLKGDQVFAKLADKNWVVTLTQDTFKKLIPDATGWRDKKVLDLDRGQIAKVRIEKGGRDVELAKVGQNWELTLGKEQAPADAKTVDKLLEALSGMEAVSFVDQPDRKFIARTKLDYPVARIKITAVNSVEPVELTIGDTTPSGMFRYVKRSGREYVAAVGAEKLALPLQSHLAYYNRRMLEFNVDNVRSIAVNHNKQTYQVERVDRNHPWKVSSPIAADADGDKVRDLLMNLMTLEAREFVGKGNPGRFNLSKPQVMVKVVTESPEANPTPTTTQAKAKMVRHEYTLGVSKLDGKTYATRPDLSDSLIGQVADSLYSDLTAELIDRRVFADLQTQGIDRVEITKPGAAPMVLEKAGGDWKYPADPVVAVDKDKVEPIVSALRQLKAVRYAAFGAKFNHGLSRPHFKISVSAGKTVYTLTVGQVVENQDRYAQTSVRPWVFILSADDLAKLDKNLKDLAKSPVAPTPAVD